MNYAVLAVLLTIMQAVPPVPRHTSDEATSGSRKVQQNSGGQKASPPPAPVEPAPPTKPQQPSASAPSEPNGKQDIAIRELPPVSVSKDLWDLSGWGFGFVLMLAGILGVCAAVRTLRAIEKQARLMKAQEGILKQSVAAAEKN